MKYISTLGKTDPVNIETAILNGYAPDGGLYVPEYIPKVSPEQLDSWRPLSFTDLAFEIISLYLDRSIVPAVDLREIIDKSYGTFESPAITPVLPCKSIKNVYILELFRGPTLSFKDIAMGFLLNLMEYFLTRRNERRNILVATTGDTGPACGYAAIGKKTINAWLLYPQGLISPEQVGQMTQLDETNIRSVAVKECPDGGDDLDRVIAQLMGDADTKKKYSISSVNSINWGRVMAQIVHHFYGYFRVTENSGEKAVIAVPGGAFGNLCSGAIAMEMGLPLEKLICANNSNATLFRIFTDGVMSRKALINTISSAMDIVIPYNFWRYLFIRTGMDHIKFRTWFDQFNKTGEVAFDAESLAQIRRGIIAESVDDQRTKALIRNLFEQEQYLLDPHGAVALESALTLKEELPEDIPLLCLATAHPAKFPKVMSEIFKDLRYQDHVRHASIDDANKYLKHYYECDLNQLYTALMHALERNIAPK